MLIMWNKYFAISYVLVWCILSLENSEAHKTASASAAAVAGRLDQDPVLPNPVVESLAHSISDGLRNSEVMRDFADFVIYQPYDLFYNVEVTYLTRFGINNATAHALAKVVADAAAKAGVVTSQVYFGAVGYTQANFLFAQGIATINNVEALTLSYVSAVGVVACVNGLSDAKSVVHAVAHGIFNVLNSYGLINYVNMAYIYYLFAQEIDVLSGVN